MPPPFQLLSLNRYVSQKTAAYAFSRDDLGKKSERVKCSAPATRWTPSHCHEPVMYVTH